MTVQLSVRQTPADLGDALAEIAIDHIVDARTAGRRILIGIPAGRTLVPVVDALAARLSDRPVDLDHVVLVLMDDYAIPDGAGFRLPDATAHYSCRHFGEVVRAQLSDAVGPRAGIAEADLWSPDPADPAAYDRDIAAAGGIDLFFVAVGVSDGHVAFNPPGTALTSRTRIIDLAESTRTDNLGTFPEFTSLDDVPRHGVSVGIGTMLDARTVVLVAHGAAKSTAVQRILEADRFDPAWPATFVHEHPAASLWADAAAAESSTAGQSVDA